MANPAEVILASLDRHLRGPAALRLMGGAALILGYGSNRATEDADLLLEQSELEVLVEHSSFGEAIEMANRELESAGLYLSHIFGPEQQILTPSWRESCRELPNAGRWRWLEVSVLGPLDLIVGKLARADEQDLDDIRFLLAHESLAPAAVREAMLGARVPKILAEAFSASCPKLERMLEELESPR